MVGSTATQASTTAVKSTSATGSTPSASSIAAGGVAADTFTSFIKVVLGLSVAVVGLQ